jgi:hypothetical protein
MALSNAAEIGSNDSYTGNAGLGEIGGSALRIDTRPLMELAAYSFEYNKAAYYQKQREIESQAKQVADMTAYDLTTAIPKDREEIQKGYNELFDYVRNDPTVLDYKNNQKGWMEYNKKKNDFENKLTGAKVRSLMDIGRQKEVQEAKTPAMKAYLQKSLDDEINATGIDTPLKYTNQFDLTPVEVTPPTMLKFDVTNMGANFLATRTHILPDMNNVAAQASAKALGLLRNPIDENSTELEKQQFEAQSASGKLEPVESANNISTVLADPRYKDPKFLKDDGTIDVEAVIKDNSGNGLVSGVLGSIKQYNDKMDEMQAQIRSGYFQDKLGKVLSFGQDGLKESDYSKIDISDGVTPEELLKVRILGLAPAPSYTTKIDQTNAAIAQQNANTSSGQLAETIRNNKAKLALDSKEFKLNEDKWKATQVGGTTQINGAMVKAKRIYSDMLKLADKNGVISPDKVRQLNAEQLKYLGVEQVETSETGVPRSIYKSLDLSTMDKDGKKVTEYAIQLVDGQIKVLKAADKYDGKLIQKASGSYEGMFDPSKSTNIYNVGTNILNEQLKTAGSKELNAYMGIDVNNGISSSTDGGSTTIQGQTQQKTNEVGSVLSGKIDPSALVTGQSYSVGGKQYIWDGKKLKAQ